MDKKEIRKIINDWDRTSIDVEVDGVDGVKELFVGQKITKVEKENITLTVWGSVDVGIMTLSNGVRIIAKPNEGCGGCDSGWYFLENINAIDHIITDVEITYKDKKETDEAYGEEKKYVPIEKTDWDYYYDTTYFLKIYSEGVFVGNALEVVGSDGNGYYGTAFELIVVQ